MAIIFREERKRKEVLVIRRAHNPQDPWSGQLAFPGGRREETDETLLFTAVRETLEEVGVDLSAAHLLGELDWVSAQPAHSDLVVAPFVFGLRHPVYPTPRASEVAGVLWADVEDLVGGTRDTRVPLRRNGVLLQLPAYDIEGSPLWGLSYVMLRSLFVQLTASVGGLPTRNS